MMTAVRSTPGVASRPTPGASLLNGSGRSSAGHVPAAFPSTVVPTGACESKSAVSTLLLLTWMRGVRTQCPACAGAASPGAHRAGRARLHPGTIGVTQVERHVHFGLTLVRARRWQARQNATYRYLCVIPGPCPRVLGTSGTPGPVRCARRALTSFVAPRNPSGVSHPRRMPRRGPRTETDHWRESRVASVQPHCWPPHWCSRPACLRRAPGENPGLHARGKALECSSRARSLDKARNTPEGS